MQKKIFNLMFVLWTAVACASRAFAVKPIDPAKYFTGLNGCFLLYDMKKNQSVLRYGDKRCEERLPACSTFKVPLALAGFDAGVLKDENQPFKWDGKKREIDSWNADQTTASWMRNSVVWVSQIIAPEIGPKKLTAYLKEFKYGTADLSGGITNAWLTQPQSPGAIPNPTMKISADEQMEFFKRLWRSELKASSRALELTKNITALDPTPNKFLLNGKTGSGRVGKDDLRLGWFVAHLQRGKEEYLAVSTFTEAKPRKDYKGYAGFEAKEIMSKVLTEAGYW